MKITMQMKHLSFISHTTSEKTTFPPMIRPIMGLPRKDTFLSTRYEFLQLNPISTRNPPIFGLNGFFLDGETKKTSLNIYLPTPMSIALR